MNNSGNYELCGNHGYGDLVAVTMGDDGGHGIYYIRLPALRSTLVPVTAFDVSTTSDHVGCDGPVLRICKLRVHLS